MLTVEKTYAFDALEARGDGLTSIKYVLTEPGVYTYQIRGKTVRALKLPEDWTSESFLASARGVPITLEHPPGLVTPKDSGQFVGLAHSEPAVARDGKVYHGATLSRQDAIDGVRTKMYRAVSAGTHVNWVDNAGVWVAQDGASFPYDVIQKNPRLNHTSLTRQPRVPSSVILANDSSDLIAVFVPDQDTMEELKELLAKFSLDSTAVAALTAIVSDRDAKLAELGRQIDGLRGERDGLKQKLDTVPSLDSIGDRVAQELQQVAAIAAKVPGLSLDALAKAKTVSERYLMALDSLKISVDSKATEDYLRGRFEGATVQSAPAAENPAPKTAPHPNSARAGIMAQDAGPKPAPSAADRIKAAKERDIRLSRGEKV